MQVADQRSCSYSAAVAAAERDQGVGTWRAQCADRKEGRGNFGGCCDCRQSLPRVRPPLRPAAAPLLAKVSPAALSTSRMRQECARAEEGRERGLGEVLGAAHCLV